MTTQVQRKKHPWYQSMFWRIASTFMFLLLLVSMVYICITIDSSEKFFQEQNQCLNQTVAEQIVKEIVSDVSPLMVDNKVNEEAVGKILHYMMAINPSIEVYLLNAQGKILDFVLPDENVKIEYVRLEPIIKFINRTGKVYLTGDNPRKPKEDQVFSAAPFKKEGIEGYVYVILSSEEHESAAAYFFNSYVMRLGTRAMITTVIAALLIGFLVFWYLIKNLQLIIRTVQDFESGNLNARIQLESKGELTELADNFNKMADTIFANIEELKSTESLRRELIANVSHDLRTPLAVIHGYVETLKMKDDSIEPEERKKYIDIIMKSTDKLKNLVSELFELSKLEAKQVKLKAEPFNLNELVFDTYSKYEILAKDKGIKMKANIQENPGAIVLADFALIERVLQNLLDNAIRFTPQEGEIRIEILPKSETVEIKVCDTGTGIPPEELPKVFDRYQTKTRANASGSSSNAGTGLGLAIVKKILELHESTIQLQSELNVGSTFSFSLPKFQQS